MVSLSISHLRRKQTGAAGIEFAMVFFVFFLLFYGLVSYGFFFMLQNSFIHAAEEGVRAAIAVDPLNCPRESSDPSEVCSSYEAKIDEVVRSTVDNALSWMPDQIKKQTIGDKGSKVLVDFTEAPKLKVLIEYADYHEHPIMPLLNIPGLGPLTPEKLQGQAILNLP